MSGISNSKRPPPTRESPAQREAILGLQERAAAALAKPEERSTAIVVMINEAAKVSPQSGKKGIHDPVREALASIEDEAFLGPQGRIRSALRRDFEVTSGRLFGVYHSPPADLQELTQALEVLDGRLAEKSLELAGVERSIEETKLKGETPFPQAILLREKLNLAVAVLKSRRADYDGTTPRYLLNLPTDLKTARAELVLVQIRSRPKFYPVEGGRSRASLSPHQSEELKERKRVLLELIGAFEELPKVTAAQKAGMMVGGNVVCAWFPKWLGGVFELGWFSPPANRRDRVSKSTPPGAELPRPYREGQRDNRWVPAIFAQTPIFIQTFRPVARTKEGEKIFNPRVALLDVAAGKDDHMGDIALFFIPGLGSVTLGSKGSITLRGPLPLHAWLALFSFLQAHGVELHFPPDIIHGIASAAQELGVMYKHRMEPGGSFGLYGRSLAPFTEPPARFVSEADYQVHKVIDPLIDDAKDWLGRAMTSIQNTGHEPETVQKEDDSQGPSSVG